MKNCTLSLKNAQHRAFLYGLFDEEHYQHEEPQPTAPKRGRPWRTDRIPEYSDWDDDARFERAARFEDALQRDGWDD